MGMTLKDSLQFLECLIETVNLYAKTVVILSQLSRFTLEMVGNFTVHTAQTNQKSCNWFY